MMKCFSIERKLRKLEGILLVDNSGNDWIDTLMWVGFEGGIFGHAHLRLSPRRCEQQVIMCSEDEEVMIMRQHYESDNHRFFGQGAKLSFAEYLERFCYLGSDKLAERRNAVIEKVRGDGNGAGIGCDPSA